MKQLLSAVLLLSLFPLTSAAQTGAPGNLPGVRFAANNNPAAASTASYAIGLTKDNGATYLDAVSVSDQVKVIGTFRPEAAHVGKKADLYVVDRVNLDFMMQNTSGAFQPWSGIVPQLVPSVVGVTLTAQMQVEVFDGALGYSGDHRFYIGYKPEGGDLYYTPAAAKFTASKNTPAEQAYTTFVTTISPNIVASRCILCHVKGGAAEAGGALHIFKTPLATSQLYNFGQFQRLLASRSISYVLSKVTGGNNHGGGVQLTASSVDYKDLEAFIRLIGQDTGATAGTQGTTTPGYDDPYANNPYGTGY